MLTDRELQQDVLDELAWEPSVNAAHVGVSVNDGIVTLSGRVSSYLEKHARGRSGWVAAAHDGRLSDEEGGMNRRSRPVEGSAQGGHDASRRSGAGAPA